MADMNSPWACCLILILNSVLGQGLDEFDNCTLNGGLRSHGFNHRNAACVSRDIKTYGLHLRCSNGIESVWLKSAHCNVRILTLVWWPDEHFPPDTILRHFPMTEVLTLSNSTVSSFSGKFPASRHLKELNLNDLGNITLRRDLFTKLSALVNLDLRRNQIETIHPDVIGSPPILDRVYLLDNKWNCSHDGFRWLARLDGYSERMARSRIVDYENLTCEGNVYWKKPVHVVMETLNVLEIECPENCTCHLTNLVQDLNKKTFIPVSTVDCRFIGLQSLPTTLPSITTTLLLQGNNISDLRPLAQNNLYKKIHDIYLDDNILSSVNPLEGADWMLTFKVLSLRGNNISQFPTYAFEHAFEYNLNIARVYLGNNPWLCNCQFTPSFQELLFKYKTIVGDISDIRCRQSDHYEISDAQINTLSRTTICKQTSESLHTVDIVNILLATLICLVIGKFCYDYYYFKKTGKLPWISSKMP